MKAVKNGDAYRNKIYSHNTSSHFVDSFFGRSRLACFAFVGIGPVSLVGDAFVIVELFKDGKGAVVVSNGRGLECVSNILILAEWCYDISCLWILWLLSLIRCYFFFLYILFIFLLLIFTTYRAYIVFFLYTVYFIVVTLDEGSRLKWFYFSKVYVICCVFSFLSMR